MQDFSVEKVRQIFGGPFFEGRDKILVLGEALKFGEIFKKFALKLLKYEKLWRNFSFFARGVGKNKNYYIHIGYGG